MCSSSHRKRTFKHLRSKDPQSAKSLDAGRNYDVKILRNGQEATVLAG